MPSLLDSLYDDLYSGSPSIFRRRQRAPSLLPGEEESLTSSLAQKALGGAAVVANTLDTPGAAVRNFLGGGETLAGLTDSNQRLSGRDLLEGWGVLGANQEGLDFGDVLGFGAEVALDPLTYLTLGASAVGKAGKLFKAAGALDDVTTAAKAAGLAKGPRTARMMSAGDAIGLLDEAAQARVTDTAARQGIDFAALADEPLGGLARFGLGNASVTFGRGPVSQAIGSGLDRLGAAAAASFPARLGAGMLEAATMGSTHAAAQEAGRKIYRQRQFIHSDMRRTAGEMRQKFQPLFRILGLESTEDRHVLADMIEGTLDEDRIPELIAKAEASGASPQEVDDLLRQFVDGNADEFASQIAEAERVGLSTSQLRDAAQINYFPHFLSMPKGRKYGGLKMVDATDPSGAKRSSFLRDIIGGRRAIREIVKDGNVLQGTLADAARYIETEYGNLFVDAAKAEQFGDDLSMAVLEGPALKEKAAQFATWIREGLSPEQRAVGGFGNEVLDDIQKRMIASREAVLAADTLAEVYARYAKVGALSDDTLSLAEALKKAGLRDKQAIKNVANKLGEAGVDLDELAGRRIDSKLVDQMTRVFKGFTDPEPVTEFYKLWDSFTNLFKIGVLTHPARYVRDAASGLFHNVVTGNISWRSFQDAGHFLRGKFDKIDALQYPFVRQRLEKMGLPLTQENAVEALRNELYAQNLVGPNAFTERALGAAAGVHDPRLGDSDVGVLGLKGVWEGLRTGNWKNPFDVRGVADKLGDGAKMRTETGFAPAKAGEAAGFTTDAFNRLTPFLANLERGVDPTEAARIAKALQVDYAPQAYSAVETQWLKRMFPFYSFTSRMAPAVVREIWERPGGALPQVIRGTNQARSDDEILPPHITQTTAIPISQRDDGTQRFLTSLGLMHEDPMGFVGGPGTVLSELASRLNPLLKAPLEVASGKSFFQRGVDGTGRELAEMDPPIGRLLANLTGSDQPWDTPLGLEILSANLPTSRLVTTAKTLTDTRKRAGDEGLLSYLPGGAALMNALTGVRFSDVTPEQQDSVLREAVEAAQRDLGAHEFETTFLPDFVKERLPAEELDAYVRLETLKRMIRKRQEARRD